MQERTRYSLSGGLSLIAHALFVLAFAWSLRVEDSPERSEELPDWDIDFIEFDVKKIEPDEAQGEPEPPEPEPPAEEEAAPPPVEQPKDPEGEATPPPPEPEPKPKPKFGAKKSKIGGLVPPNATWTLVLANKRIKKLPFRDAATEVMAPLRDFRLLIDDAGFDIWEDFDFVVMGSPDATDQTQAFVAVQYSFGHEEMKAGVVRACAKHEMIVDWREENKAWVGDPRFADPEIEARNTDDRQFVLLPGDNVALYLREAFIEQVVAGPDASKGKTSGNFVANIARIRRFVAAEPKAGVQLIVEDIRGMIRVGSKFPFEIPARAELMWEAAKNPELVIKLDFLETEHAEGAERYWDEELEDQLRALKVWDGLVGGIVSSVELERVKRQLTLRYEFNEVSARVTLELIAGEFGKAMRWTEKKAKAAQEARAANWAQREGGKRLPSEIFELEEEESPPPAESPVEAEKPEPASPEAEKPEPASPEAEKPERPEPESPGPEELPPSE